MKKYCPHCWPKKRKTHLFLHFNYYLDSFLKILSRPIRSLTKKIENNTFFWILFVEFFSLFKIVQFESDPDKSKLYNRSYIFFTEAKKRDLDIYAIKFFGKYINEFKLKYAGKNYYYKEIPLTLFEKSVSVMDDKSRFKQIMKSHGLPIAEGSTFRNEKKAFEFGLGIGFPLVVKPREGSLSHHASYPINSKDQLLQAIKIAKKYKPAFIVEKYFSGNLYRASVIGKRELFICRKDRPNIVGDGSSTIKELIDTKNKDDNRGRANQKDSTLHRIPLNRELKENLKKQNLTLTSVPPKGEKVILIDKYVLAYGCDIINVKDIAHDENKKLFFKIAEVLDSDLVGIDLIAPDIGKSYKKQKAAILEANSLPFVDMHQFPSHGKKEAVAEKTWDIVLKRLSNKK